MTTERMVYFARKYLEERIRFWEDVAEDAEEAMNILEDYRQELRELLRQDLSGNLTEEGHW